MYSFPDKIMAKPTQPGILFPFSVLITTILLATISLWYRQILLQSFIAERLLQQHTLYIECNSLLPILREKLRQQTTEELLQEDKDFFRVEVRHIARWSIERSALKNKQIRFTFHLLGQNIEALQLTVPYNSS
ncbi:MAG: hypothetical protein COB67_05135 [SAR324 cluster bacterium]|uniref:Uncharacterized protein n=1 Tax=SAR324 cluster bacterium TaxID=2024889 RepID=A0A2A4T6R3_9DELT|nr:MAG: hypothetical protein COB67_05135 [SAR324 cluster bacterium]